MTKDAPTRFKLLTEATGDSQNGWIIKPDTAIFLKKEASTALTLSAQLTEGKHRGSAMSKPTGTAAPSPQPIPGCLSILTPPREHIQGAHPREHIQRLPSQGTASPRWHQHGPGPGTHLRPAGSAQAAGGSSGADAAAAGAAA